MPSDAPRLLAIRHIVHEYANFVSTAEMVIHGRDAEGGIIRPPLNTHVSHAYFLNCRKLADFFQSHQGKGDDDVLACHFVEGYSANLPHCDEWRRPMNKQLAHVTYSREWHAREIDRDACVALYAELKAAWRDLRNRLPELYAAEFTRQIALCKGPDAHGQPSEFRSYDLD